MILRWFILFVLTICFISCAFVNAELLNNNVFLEMSKRQEKINQESKHSVVATSLVHKKNMVKMMAMYLT